MNNNDFEKRFLERGKKRHEEGDKAALLYYLEHCIINHVPIPAWLEQAFRDACDAARMYKIKSWDEVFGKPLKKGKRLARERRNMEIAQPLYNSVQKRHKAGEPIDKKLFEAVGKQFGISGTTASELYYETTKEMIGVIEDAINDGK